MKQVSLFAIGLFLLGQMAFAGAESGGGGGAYVCRNPATGEVNNAELVDLWEGRVLEGLNIPISTADVEAQISAALLKLQPVDPFLYQRALSEFTRIKLTAQRLPSGVSLPAPKDANPNLIKTGCPLEGMMYYDGDLDHLMISPTIFDKLQDNANIAATWVHETIYKILRDTMRQKESRRARELTACLFATGDCFGPKIELPKDAEFALSCKGKSNDFIYYHAPNIGENHKIYTRVGGHEITGGLAQDVPEHLLHSSLSGVLQKFDFVSFTYESKYIGDGRGIELYVDGKKIEDEPEYDSIISNATHDVVVDDFKMDCKRIK